MKGSQEWWGGYFFCLLTIAPSANSPEDEVECSSSPSRELAQEWAWLGVMITRMKLGYDGEDFRNTPRPLGLLTVFCFNCSKSSNKKEQKKAPQLDKRSEKYWSGCLDWGRAGRKDPIVVGLIGRSFFPLVDRFDWFERGEQGSNVLKTRRGLPPFRLNMFHMIVRRTRSSQWQLWSTANRT